MTPSLGRRLSRSARPLLLLTLLATIGFLWTAPPSTAVTSSGVLLAPAVAAPGDPDLGPNTYVFDPSMSVDEIQATVDAVSKQQLGNQFGTERVALLFKPGTYGSAAQPLNFEVGYYTEVAGLGRNPGDVVINGSVNVYNQCDNGTCIALNNFWRSLSNLTIDVTNPAFGCHTGEFWAVSQAAPMRRVHINGLTTLMDYCSGPSFASGGFIADSRFDGGTVVNGSQQQFYVRNSALDGWTNGVWNQVFSGDTGAVPAQCFPADASCGGPYTTLATTPQSREKPYLYVDGSGAWRVFVPGAAAGSSGPTWDAGSDTPGRSLPLSSFYVAHPGDSAANLDSQLARGKNLLVTPGVYDVGRTLDVRRADTVVLGMGLATLTATRGAVPLAIADVPGVDIAGLTIDAGSTESPALLRVGTAHGKRSSAADPTALQDVFFRIGGPHEGRATTSLVVNSDHVVLDDIWAWRADHGAGVGWTQNTADTGLVVNGDDVSATGLFVEHYQKHEVIWNGERGSVVFFQNELPYDVPSQAAWRSTPTTDGYAALKVADRVRSFTGDGLGSYSFFNQGVDIFADHAFEVPTTPGVHLHDLLTIFLDPNNGRGGIRHVVNDTGGSSTIANPDVPVTLVDYP
ncbi:glycosyl hydrolase family 28-related protein [Nocardioides cynanchi]|uniref:glycosyl hydrolase family 28-related protein n=1 Tax=Nocardioides cynanchi TaxID=2558918 RepID=UPI0012471967|nr:glycosyl hydrolase family 28-related protein [Nocardioides cynanchi]